MNQSSYCNAKYVTEIQKMIRQSYAGGS